MPESVNDNSGSKKSRNTVEKNDERVVRGIHATRSLGCGGQHKCSNPEATKGEQSELLHMAS
jgi:hypothetical protein